MKDNFSPAYLKVIQDECQRHPCLQHLAEFCLKKNSHRHSCRFECLQFDANSVTPQIRRLKWEELLETLQEYHVNAGDVLGRMLIVEDLTADVIELLGSSLDIDPLFFASHLHMTRSDKTTERPDVRLLPSASRWTKFVSVIYHRPLTVNGMSVPKKLISDTNVRRKVGFHQSGNQPAVGMMQAAFTALMIAKTGKSWFGKNRQKI